MDRVGTCPRLRGGHRHPLGGRRVRDDEIGGVGSPADVREHDPGSPRCRWPGRPSLRSRWRRSSWPAEGTPLDALRLEHLDLPSMPETVDNLILDLLEWIGPGQRPYAETLGGLAKRRARVSPGSGRRHRQGLHRAPPRAWPWRARLRVGIRGGAFENAPEGVASRWMESRMSAGLTPDNRASSRKPQTESVSDCLTSLRCRSRRRRPSRPWSRCRGSPSWEIAHRTSIVKSSLYSAGRDVRPPSAEGGRRPGLAMPFHHNVVPTCRR